MWDTEAVYQEATFYCASTDLADLCPKAEPKNKMVSPYIPLQAGYRSKEQSSTHIWLHVTSMAISFPQCYVTFFMFHFLKFYLSALPSLPPASLSEHSLSVYLLGLHPATLYVCTTMPRCTPSPKGSTMSTLPH
jgi:hypothetical protein